jgi:ACS family tartrate transporter-like MFS transporter
MAPVGVILALALVNVGVNGSKGPMLAMPSLFLTGAGAAAGIALINSIGNLGGFIGPLAVGWVKDRWGSYAGGFYLVGGMLALSAIVLLALNRPSERSTPAAEPEDDAA